MKVKFSILTPIYNTPLIFLQEMIESVQKQSYKNWELCLADGSDTNHKYVKQYIEECQKQDSRIIYKKLEENKGISANTNACIDISSGNYMALLDHDDILDEKALETVYKVIKRENADFIYTDEAKFTESIEHWFSPNYKPDYAPDELLSHNYICHLTVYSRELMERVGHYRSQFDGSQDHDMVLRLTHKADKIVHISKILYYWRVHKDSVSSGVEAKEYAIEAAKKAVLEHINRMGESGEVITHEPYKLLYHVKYELKIKALVSIIIYGECDSISVKRCINSILNYQNYDSLEFIIITNSKEKKEIEYFCKSKFISYHYSIIDNKKSHISDDNIKLNAKGNYLFFINGNCEVESENFITELLMTAQRKNVACVGSKIYSEDGFIKDGGIALAQSMREKVIFRYSGECLNSEGYEAALKHVRNVTALSGEGFIIETNKFYKLGGFEKSDSWYWSINLGLRAKQLGYVNVWTPYSEILSHQAKEVPTNCEIEAFSSRWRHLLVKEDIYYNKNIRYDIDNIHDKNTFPILCKKIINYLYDGGISEVFRRFQIYRGNLVHEHSSLHTNYSPSVVNHEYKDVLFINGCAPSVPHPPRYRVTHQREQLLAGNIKSDEIYYEHLNPDVVKYYRLFIIFRCPYTDNIGKLIKLAKEYNKTVLFDIDDLVIDTKYTNAIPYVMELDGDEKKLYNDGVIRMGKTLKLCDGAITTTKRLAQELGRYVPEVLINRNTASERMYELSEEAIFERDILPILSEKELDKSVSLNWYKSALRKAKERDNSGVRIGYFSGSITHNDDFNMIMPALVDIMQEFPNVKLHLVGELGIPEEFKALKKQIVIEPFMEWEELPRLIASVDINLAPITKTIFNEAKSENKWTEAALVKVPTVASNVGAFADAIINKETGILCDTREEWYQGLKLLVSNRGERRRIAENAYQYVISHYITVYANSILVKYVREKMNQNVCFVLPSTEISGGIMVALKHASILKEQGKDVFIINEGIKDSEIMFEQNIFPVLSRKNTDFYGRIDKCISTMWNTMDFLEKYPNIEKRFYLVQNYETDFYRPNNQLRIMAEQSYHPVTDVNFVTISRWVENWLLEKYGIKSSYIPNGISIADFSFKERNFNEKIRILVEGDSSVHYKNVDESFRIIEKLDRNRFEIWYVSYNGAPKNWYRVDKFLRKVPYDNMPDLYKQCHILLKSSLLESFSYPPLEMMATGGYVVAVQNGGNSEFLVDRVNCLIYKEGDLDAAISSIEEICSNKHLREVLSEGAVKTVKKRSWDNCKSIIINNYLN